VKERQKAGERKRSLGKERGGERHTEKERARESKRGRGKESKREQEPKIRRKRVLVNMLACLGGETVRQSQTKSDKGTKNGRGTE